MPVPTFSPAQSARHRSLLVSRSNSARDRIDVDQSRRSMREMQELDGMGLYDRPDWPLPSASSPEGDQSAKALVEQHGRAEMEDERANENAESRKPEGIGGTLGNGLHFEEHDDVSDLEDEDMDDVLAHRANTRSLPPQYLPRRDPYHGTSDLRRESHRSLITPQRETHIDISPVREEYPSAPSSIGEPPDDARLDHVEQQQQEQPDTLSDIDEHEESQRDEDVDGGELHDLAIAVPLGSDPPDLQQHQHQGPSTQDHSPLLNGHFTHMLPTTAHTTPRSSAFKGPMNSPPQRRSSTRNRSSWVNPNKSEKRLRYSWQSVHEDEPNRPRIHIIKLVSNTVTASAGFPTGEAFGFSISPAGRKIAAYNSARLYVLQTNALPVGISQDYALKRRPLAVELTDECNTMAILADDHTVNIYDTGLDLKRVRTIKLDFPTNCIALAPSGGMLAAAYEGGVEVFSLARSALPTDRRAVRSVKMDRLSFSEDGATLLGTTTRINACSTVVVNVPIFPAAPDGVPTHEELKEAWCSELLHPENIRNSSHAMFMRENRNVSNERVFAWNGLEDTFGILNVGDMQYGNIDFPVVISPPLSTCGGLGAAIHSCPTIDEHGDTVAMIVNDRTVRLYVIPPKIDEASTSVEAHSIDHELDEGYGCPFNEARWVHSPASFPAPLHNQTQVKGRLAVTSPGGVVESGTSEEGVEDIEGGRIIIFDFDPQFAGQPAQTFSLALGKSPPQMLEEEEADLAEQVALVRRRTVNQSKGKDLSTRPATLGRAATTTGPRPLRTTSSTINANLGPPRTRSSMLSIGSMQSEASRSLPDLMEGTETADAFEEPYVQGAPRSHASLQRAASNVQRHRFQTLEERQREQISVDSHGDFLALPEYTEEPNAPLPNKYRRMAGLDEPVLFSPSKPAVTINRNGSMAGSSSSSPSSSTPQTAPPDIGEHFSADLAFRAANAQAAAARDAATFRDLLPDRAPPNTGSSTSKRIPLSVREPQRTGEASTIRETAMDRPGNSSITPSPVSTPTSTSRGDPSTYFRPPDRGPSRDSYTPTRGSGTFDSINSAHGTSLFSAVPPSTLPPARSGTFDSLVPLPRSLQRAYSNAISPIGSGPPPGLIGDWRNVSPVSSSTSPHLYARGSTPSISSGEVPPNEAWHVISPVTPTRQFSSSAQQPTNRYRHSTSLLDPVGHASQARAPSSSSSYATTLNGTSSPPGSPGERSLPQHVRAFRSAAGASASASLFPPNQPRDHVPLRQNNIVKAGSVAHPITAWHPPAAASTPNLQRTGGSIRGHRSRVGSVSGRSAFASTARAKKLGFFKKSRRHDPYGFSTRNGEPEGGSMMEAKSVMTWATKTGSKCSVM